MFRNFLFTAAYSQSDPTARLAQAAHCGDCGKIEQYIQEGGDVNQGPLHCAVLARKYNAADLLLQRGADPNLKHLDMATPFRLAVQNGSERMVSLLLEYGASVSDDTGFGVEGSLLHVAAGDKGSGRLVSLLLRHGAQPNARAPGGATPLMRAEQEYSAQLLLDAGADVNAVDEHGCTALHQAARYNLPKVVAVLLAHGADANKASSLGKIARDDASMRLFLCHDASRGIAAQRYAAVVAMLDTHQRQQLTRRLFDVCATLTLVGAPVLVLLECFSWVANEMLGPVELPLELQWRIAARVRGALVRQLAAQQGVEY